MQLKAVYTACKLNNDQMTESTNVRTVYVQQLPLFFAKKGLCPLNSSQSLWKRAERLFDKSIFWTYTKIEILQRFVAATQGEK